MGGFPEQQMPQQQMALLPPPERGLSDMTVAEVYDHITIADALVMVVLGACGVGGDSMEAWVNDNEEGKGQ